MHAVTSLPATNVRTWPVVHRWPALLVLLLGMGFLYAVGFSTLPQAHNAAHDTLHANGLPCH